MGKHRRKYVPSPKATPQTEKRPKAILTGGSACLQWSFAIFDPHAWHVDTTYCVRQLATHMRTYERMTWADIKRRDHPVPKNRIITKAQQRLVDIGQDDVSELWRLAFAGKPRVWGLRQADVFQVLWWDPEHLICPSAKKHT